MAQTINVDMTPGLFMPTLHYSQGDVGREFVINLSTRDGMTIPAGATVTMQATKPSGFGFSVTGTLSGSVATFTTTDTMTDESGRFQAEIVIAQGTTVIGTTNFWLEGEKNPHPEGTIDGSEGTIIPELTLLVERVETAASSILDMTVEAETLAAGSQATYSYDEDTNTATFGIPQGEAGAGSAGVVASAYSSSSTYAVGDYVIHNSNLYRCTTAITTAESFTAAHWTQVVLGDDVSDLKSDLNDTIADIGNLSNLETTDKSNLVNAVNELEELFSAPTQEAVDDWLDRHPEATTTVQDHSLTYEKLVNGTLGFVTPEMFGAIENGVCNIEKFQTMLNSAKYVRFTSDFEFPFIPNSTVASPTRIKIENKKGLVIDGCGHTVTMSGLTKEYLESINDISSSGRDVFSFLAFHNCENITVKDIDFVGTNAVNANNAFRFASPRSICVAFKGCNNCFVENVNGINILGNVVNTTTADDLSTGCNKIIIANCKAQNCYENGFNIMGESSYCVIDGCTSIRCGTGVEAFGDTCIIQNCIISKARSTGIAISGGATARNNKVIGSIGEGAGLGIGIAVTGASTLISKNCKVLNNHVKDCKGYGIYVYPYTENTEVKGNVFENNNTINTYTVANNISGTANNKTKDLIIDSNIFKSTIDDQKCFMASNVNGVMFTNNIVDHVLSTAVYSINFDGTCENFKACGNTLTKRVNKSGTPTNYFIGNNVVGKTIPEIVSD